MNKKEVVWDVEPRIIIETRSDKDTYEIDGYVVFVHGVQIIDGKSTEVAIALQFREIAPDPGEFSKELEYFRLTGKNINYE